MDYLLRTTTESDMDDALIAAGLAQEVTDSEGEVVVLATSGVIVDHIGAISGDSRWHTNVRVSFELSEGQEALLPTFEPLPTIPYRVFI